MSKLVCGIDEAGRGPLAGPLCVAGVVLLGHIDGLNDSKKLTSTKREYLYDKIVQNSRYRIVFKSSEFIDTYGISKAIASSLEDIQHKIEAKLYLFDGNSSYGISEIETIIKGDSLVDEIKAASILAKVSRDRYMKKLCSMYPSYSFAKHKGYGTKAHIEEIKEFGFCAEHRKSYRVKSLQGNLWDRQ
ncbi:MAG: ribonuclease HII [Campylobacterales bacterium]